jgi:hypothetical protein
VAELVGVDGGDDAHEVLEESRVPVCLDNAGYCVIIYFKYKDNKTKGEIYSL